jgi:hypothetical protein
MQPALIRLHCGFSSLRLHSTCVGLCCAVLCRAVLCCAVCVCVYVCVCTCVWSCVRRVVCAQFAEGNFYLPGDTSFEMAAARLLGIWYGRPGVLAHPAVVTLRYHCRGPRDARRVTLESCRRRPLEVRASAAASPLR